MFTTISELIAGTEFQDASIQYMYKHKDVFTDDDENKLEYTTIFEEFVQILEKIIDSQLLTKFTQDQISEFYQDFALNFAEYAKIDNDAVETLFGFIDFQKFKKQMLEVKNGEVTVSQNESNQGIGQTDESFFWSLLKEDVNDKSIGWQKKMDHKGPLSFTSWQRPLGKGTNQILGRAEIVHKDIRMSTVLQYIKDVYKHQPE